MKKDVDIYRCKKKEGAYVYLEKGYDLEQLPEALIQQTGKLEFSMTLEITPERKLAQTTPEKVLSAIESQGFFLQLPPSSERYMQQIPNDKMTQRPI